MKIKITDNILDDKPENVLNQFSNTEKMAISPNDEVFATGMAYMIIIWNKNIEIIYNFQVPREDSGYMCELNQKSHEHRNLMLNNPKENCKGLVAICFKNDKSSNLILSVATTEGKIYRWDVDISKKGEDKYNVERYLQKHKIKWSTNSSCFAVVYLKKEVFIENLKT